ncbi:MAG: tetratricopeptide repeat protein, partial [Flammeovirgaceae bacterium]
MALAHFNEAIRLEPFMWSAYFSRAQTRQRLGDTKGAITDLNIFLEANPQNAEALFSRAVLHYDNGQWAGAREDFLKLLSAPASETTTVYFQMDKGNRVNGMFTAQNDIRPTCLNYLGLIDVKLTQYQRAISYFDSAVALAPKYADGIVNRGLCYLHLRDTVKALSDFQRALENSPDNSLAQHNIAVLAGFKGNLRETERMLSQAIEQKPEVPYSYIERGHVRFRQQNYRGALA